MTTKVLSIITTAYRGTVEEQDDTVLWLTHMLKTSGLSMTVVLRGNAVNYAVRGQDASGLRFGNVSVAHPPALDADLAALVDHGVPVYYAAGDVEPRGIPIERLIDGVYPIDAPGLVDLCDQHDHVWAW